MPDNGPVKSKRDTSRSDDRSGKARRLGWVSIVETLSFLGLLSAMFLESETGVSILGAIHGLLFLVYAFYVWIDHRDLGWGSWFAVASVLTGPLGAIVVLERLRRERPGLRSGPVPSPPS